MAEWKEALNLDPGRGRSLFFSSHGLLLCTDLGIGPLVSQTSFDTKGFRRVFNPRDAHTSNVLENILTTSSPGESVCV